MVAADPLYEKLIKQLLLPELVLNILSPCFESFGCPLKRQITEDHLDVTIKYYGSQMNGHTIILCYIDKGTIEEPSGITSIVNLGYALRTKAHGLFFFTTAETLDENYKYRLPRGWKDDCKSLDQVKFFAKDDIQSLQNIDDLSKRKNLIKDMLDVDDFFGNNDNEYAVPTKTPLGLIKIPEEKEQFIADILADQALNTSMSVEEYFLGIYKEILLPNDWRTWKPSPGATSSAKSLIAFTRSKGEYPPSVIQGEGYTVLGYLLRILIKQVGNEQIIYLCECIKEYKLVSESIFEEIRREYLKS